ncbi:MAG: UDP-N-acetylmuramoyl-L-alanyl-D-glutamate--2,6-diaminopimelate ligase [Kiritimatiellae bacterium]|nr:UDP-N-acetylmuramoyl-L-alanyl-D-glutamate--2,6-diaminopimelate ligase [Kiritimatiellia bacterium]
MTTTIDALTGFKGISCDSRTVERGEIFAAVPGVNVAGAKFARAAVERGAAAIAAPCEDAEEIEAMKLGVPVFAVAERGNFRKWLGEAASRIYGEPSRKMAVWGITGTNGKTTTTWILREFLGAEKCGMVTTVESFTGARMFASEHTTPDAITLQKLFKEMVGAGMRNAVMEVSSHAADMQRTAGTLFAGAAFTNLTEDHLDYHKTMENYFNAKAAWIRRVGEEKPGAPVAILPHVPGGREMLAVARDAGMEILDVAAGDFEGFVRKTSALAGEYNVQNVMLAAALARAAGVDEDAIRATVPRLRPRWGRLEKVCTKSRAEVFVDFAHTPDAIGNVLGTVKKFAKGRVIAVFGAGGDRDRMKRAPMGGAAAKFADVAIVTSDNPRSEDPAEIISQIVAGMPQRGERIVEIDRRKAIFTALDIAKEGDVVVICGKGHETTQEIAGVLHPFDDRIVAREWQNENGSCKLY